MLARASCERVPFPERSLTSWSLTCVAPQLVKPSRARAHEAQEVEPRLRLDAATVVSRLTVVVEHGQVDPAEVRAESRAADDVGDVEYTLFLQDGYSDGPGGTPASLARVGRDRSRHVLLSDTFSPSHPSVHVSQRPARPGRVPRASAANRRRSASRSRSAWCSLPSMRYCSSTAAPFVRCHDDR
jgi:hypothetical protein